ncbi:hypothetical protein BT93_H2158 [Corymbia citriodora subsp. variegata]|nr:hypothetical protein BT93_H2158 [Corymbia citriodora subsp. variegata]
MGKRRGTTLISHTLPSSPSRSFSSSSSSDFEFTISLSPLNKSPSALCVADELFYKGQLLPLQLSPRLSMVRTLRASSSSSASDSATTSSRDSSGSSTDSQYSFAATAGGGGAGGECDSSRPSSVTEDDEFRRLHCGPGHAGGNPAAQIRKGKYFLARFSSVFRKEPGKGREAHYNLSGPSSSSSSSVKKRVSATAKEVIRKYLKKVKPLYEKLSQKQQQQQQKSEISPSPAKTSPRSSFSQPLRTERTVREIMLSSGKSARKDGGAALSNSFSGNLRYPRKRSCASSCPSSMRSSPSHSGVLSRSGCGAVGVARTFGGCSSEASSMEELQSAIQGAIAHCKNSMLQSNYKVMVSNEI